MCGAGRAALALDVSRAPWRRARWSRARRCRAARRPSPSGAGSAPAGRFGDGAGASKTSSKAPGVETCAGAADCGRRRDRRSLPHGSLRCGCGFASRRTWRAVADWSRRARARARRCRRCPSAARVPFSSCSISSGSAATASRSTVTIGWRAGERVVEQPVQQILDGPGELAELARADHAAAALQRVERAAQRDEHVLLERVLFPGRELPRDLRELLARFLDEELHELRIRSSRAAARRRARRQRRRAARRRRVRRRLRLGAARTARRICSVCANADGSTGATVGTDGAGSLSSVCRQVSALSSMYQGSLRPDCSVSM